MNSILVTLVFLLIQNLGLIFIYLDLYSRIYFPFPISDIYASLWPGHMHFKDVYYITLHFIYHCMALFHHHFTHELVILLYDFSLLHCFLFPINSFPFCRFWTSQRFRFC